MPLLYGEGATRAFCRLQMAILDQTGDPSLLYWTQPPKPLCLLHPALAPSVSLFTGGMSRSGEVDIDPESGQYFDGINRFCKLQHGFLKLRLDVKEIVTERGLAYLHRSPFRTSKHNQAINLCIYRDQMLDISAIHRMGPEESPNEFFARLQEACRAAFADDETPVQYKTFTFVMPDDAA
jgi:hypothetical protein